MAKKKCTGNYTGKCTTKEGVLKKLGPAETKLFNYMAEGITKSEHLASRLRVGLRRIRAIKSQLKKKGLIDKHGFICTEKIGTLSLKEVEKTRLKNSDWRFHKLHILVKPYYFYPRWHKIRTEFGNYGIPFYNWTLMIHPDMIEFRLREGIDFAHPDRFQATAKAQDDLNRAIVRASNKFGFEVFKNQKCNIRIVDQHFSNTPSDVAKASKDDYLQIKGFDGKVFFQFDKSKGPKEMEFPHPERAQSDAEIFDPFFNDIRNHPELPEISEMWRILSASIKRQDQVLREILTIERETQASIGIIAMYIQTQINQVPQSPEVKEDPGYIG